MHSYSVSWSKMPQELSSQVSAPKCAQAATSILGGRLLYGKLLWWLQSLTIAMRELPRQDSCSSNSDNSGRSINVLVHQHVGSIGQPTHEPIMACHLVN